MNHERDWREWLRFITPILVTIGLFWINDIRIASRQDLGEIKATLVSIDEKLFKHLTNDEIHCPRSLVVTQPEFKIYQEMRQRQMDDLRIGLTTRIDAIKLSLDKVIDMLENGKSRR